MQTYKCRSCANPCLLPLPFSCLTLKVCMSCATGPASFKAGEIITEQDTIGDSMYLVTSGCCYVTVEVEGKENTPGWEHRPCACSAKLPEALGA